MRKLLIGIIIILLLIPSVVSVSVNKTSQSKNGNILYVGGSGPGNYTKIQDAIDNSSDGDTVFVYDGIYYENVVINKSRISLIGENKETTIIDGGGFGSVVHINYKGTEVTISGFTIQNSGEDWVRHYAGIEIRNEGNTITGNIIRKNPIKGITSGSDSQDINQNIIMDSNWGIYLVGSDLNNIYDNYIVNNSEGLYVQAPMPIDIDMFSSFSSESLYIGRHDNDNYIFRNIFRNNRVGIGIGPDHDNYVYENIIQENDFGILIYAFFPDSACWENYIYLNNIINNDIGICLSSSRKTSIVNNEIYQNNFINNSKGIKTSIGWKCVIRDNEIYQNNFLGNTINARGNGDNIWEENYWDNWIGVKIKLPIFQRFPKIIFGFFKLNFDWNPVSEPYDIGV